MLGSFTFILHTHLPYVLHHGKWPHGSDWLSEAVAECYLPILGVLEGLQAEGLAPRISMDFSPVNLEQLADPSFADVFVAYCDEKILAAEKDYAYFATMGEQHNQPLAEFWREFYSRAKNLFTQKYQYDVVAGFRKLSDAGILDAMTCGATHGYFPFLLRDDNIRAQLYCAIATHEKHFGKRPRGIWIPECGYRPSYKWSPPVGPPEYQAQSEERAGIEELLAEVGLEYFVVDGAMTRGAMTRNESGFTFGPPRSLADIYWVDSRNPQHSDSRNPQHSDSRKPTGLAAIFSRNPKSASRVWSAELGYPGAGVYLDFHKKHHNSGLRYWRVTGSRVDMGDKKPYVPIQTEWQLDIDADDFVSLVRRELEDHQKKQGRAGILAAPFDTELFGHWWFEGPRFLEKVMRRMSSCDIKITDCAEAIDHYDAPHVTIALPEGSWGQGGYHYVWANREVAWMWDAIYPLEDRFLKLLHILHYPPAPSSLRGGGEPLEESDLLRTIVEQAARELLLMESSDWQFVISTGGATDYSKERFAEHCEFLTRLLDMAERYDAGEGLNEDDAEVLQEALIKDRPFAEIDLAWWLGLNTPSMRAPAGSDI